MGAAFCRLLLKRKTVPPGEYMTALIPVTLGLRGVAAKPALARIYASAGGSGCGEAAFCRLFLRR